MFGKEGQVSGFLFLTLLGTKQSKCTASFYDNGLINDHESCMKGNNDKNVVDSSITKEHDGILHCSSANKVLISHRYSISLKVHIYVTSIFDIFYISTSSVFHVVYYDNKKVMITIIQWCWLVCDNRYVSLNYCTSNFLGCVGDL